VGGLTARHPFLDYGGPIPFAHRGGSEGHPENTLAAFAAAIDLGYRYLETDVHATADGVLIAFHDERLDRLTDRTGLVAEMPWSDIRQACVVGREPIVAFDELLGAFPEARINVDPKHDAAVPLLIRAMRDPGIAARLCIGSFSDRRVAEIRGAIGPAACTALGPWEIAALRAGAWGVRPLLGRLGKRAGRCVQIPQWGRGGIPLIEPRLITAAHDLGLPVHVWTINEPDEMGRLLDLGVDGLFTDRPTVLRSVLQERDAWVAADARPGPPAGPGAGSSR
jgi:glycerophosphoryl diester phosphodiesterase